MSEISSRDLMSLYFDQTGGHQGPPRTTEQVASHLKGLQAVWDRAQLATRAEILGDAETEWGIAYVDNDKVFPVDPIRNPKAAQGIFEHYSVPGDKLVKRIVHAWEIVDEKEESKND